MPPPQPSLLPLVLAADNFPNVSEAYPTHHPDTREPYVPFHISSSDFESRLPPVGLLRPAVLRSLLDANPEGSSQFEFVRKHGEDAYDAIACVAFSPSVLSEGREAMNKAIADTAAQWKREGRFPEALDGASPAHGPSPALCPWPPSAPNGGDTGPCACARHV